LEDTVDEQLLEAQRLRMRTQYDLEMIQEVGYCNGIENYSAPIDGRAPGEAPYSACGQKSVEMTASSSKTTGLSPSGLLAHFKSES
jgi:hypothetical protein